MMRFLMEMAVRISSCTYWLVSAEGVMASA